MKLKDFLFEAGSYLVEVLLFISIPFLMVSLLVHLFLMALWILAKRFSRIATFVYNCSEKMLTWWLGLFESMLVEDE